MLGDTVGDDADGVLNGGARNLGIIEFLVSRSMLGAKNVRTSADALYVLALCLAVGLVGGCAALPSLEDRSTSTTVFDTRDTRLGKLISPLVDAHPGLSGIYPLPNARDAFAARMLLAQDAERTLDARYYIWRNDVSGTLLFDALRAAADRGVRVRLLLDDNDTSGLDTILASLDAHPNIEVRLFNPFVIREARWMGYVTDFSRLNRRMHNKSFTADNQATIIGGRNVGDEYFGVTQGLLFADLDVLAVGPVVTEVSEDFDRYWASESSYPVSRLVPAVEPAAVAELTLSAREVERDLAAVTYLSAVRKLPFVEEMDEGSLVLDWSATRLISDDPAKVLGLAAPATLLSPKLTEIIGESAREFYMESPYLVPTTGEFDAFLGLAERGVKIKVLTNSLETTDVPIVHAGYARRRKPLLEAGVSLYELRRSPADATPRRAVGRPSSSASSLHAKAFLVDNARVFIGSFNFDPRSSTLNTEMGFVIDSPALAQSMEAALSRRFVTTAYEVRLSDTGELYWIERRGGESVRHDTEPGTSVWERMKIWLMSLLPIEWLL
jgi:cardiolipin synthase C